MEESEVIYIDESNLDVLDTLKCPQKFSYKCKMCGKEVIRKFQCKKYILRYKRLLCKRCGTKATCLEKYGVESPSQSVKIREKQKATMLEKYGVEYTGQSSELMKKVKATCLEKYGVENPGQSLEIQEKMKATLLEHYGVEYMMQSSELREKSKAIMLEKYGVEYTGQSPELQAKMKATMMGRYGVENSMRSPEVREKYKATLLEHYGVEVPIQSSELRKKINATMLEKYGVEYPMQSPEIWERIKVTMVERYGAEYSTQSSELRGKIKAIMLEKYGTEHPSKNYIEYDGQQFDSSWEVIFYRYWSSVPRAVIKREPCSFQYVFEDKVHEYIPDFWLKKPDGTEGYYEVKGDHFFAIREGREVMVNPFDHSQDGLFEAKHQCAIEHGVIFVRQKDIEELDMQAKKLKKKAEVKEHIA